MSLSALLQFIPLAIGLLIAYQLVIKQGLPSKGLGQILSYFLGILIIFFAIGWLINGYLARWANNMLQTATTSADLQQLMDTTESIFAEAFGTNTTTSVSIPAPAQQTQLVSPASQPLIVVTATPAPPGIILAPESAVPQNGGGATQHIVAQGDTLSGISQAYGVALYDLMAVNNLTSYLIYPGQLLYIPSR